MKQGTINSKIAVLVVSCDGYCDLWDPFFTLFNRFWPDCPHRLYLCSNHKAHTAPGLTSITVGPDVSWSGNLKKALASIEEDYVLLLLDDLLLTAPVDNAAVQSIFNWFTASAAACLRMNPSPPPDRDLPAALGPASIGIASPGTLYRVSTVATLWHKSLLGGLLRDGETAWDFEIHGTVRADSLPGFYASKSKNLAIANAVIKGKWVPAVSRQISALGLSRDRFRPMMNWREVMKLRGLVLRSRLLRLLPAGMRRTVKDRILRGQYNYKISR